MRKAPHRDSKIAKMLRNHKYELPKKPGCQFHVSFPKATTLSNNEKHDINLPVVRIRAPSLNFEDFLEFGVHV